MKGAREEGSVHRRRMAEKGDERRFSRQGRSSKNVRENLQASVSEDIRSLRVEEDGLIGRFVGHHRSGEGEECDLDYECFNGHDEEEVKDEVGYCAYPYTRGGGNTEEKQSKRMMILLTAACQHDLMQGYFQA